MKYLFFLTLILASLAIGHTQACLPDSTLIDSSAGVYPKPITPENPNGGIKKKACINKPYDFVFTVVVPDTVLVPIFPSPLALEKVFIDTAGAISNLPAGIHYQCNPPNCVFKKNTFGCLILNGIPTISNQPGDYKPIIKLKLTVNVGVPFDYATEYPGPAFPGEYKLTLLSENDCASNANEGVLESNSWYPNPFYGDVIYTDQELISNFRMYDILGNLILAQNEVNGRKIELTNVHTSSFYILRWTSTGKNYSQKLSIPMKD